MILQNLPECAYKTVTPFVVQEADVNLFETFDDFGLRLLQEEEEEAEAKSRQLQEEEQRRRLSIGSSTSDYTTPSISSNNGRVKSRRVSSRRRTSSSSISSSCSSSSCSSSSTSSSACSKSFHLRDDFDEHDDHSSLSSMSGSRRPSHASNNSSNGSGRVSFSNSITVRSIPHLEDITDEELSASWYRDFELDHMKEEAHALIEQIKKTGEHPSDPSDMRGLRIYQKKRRKSLWVMALTCVLDEQAKQKKLGVSDPEKLATLYKSFTTFPTQVAAALGKEDEDYAKVVDSAENPQ